MYITKIRLQITKSLRCKILQLLQTNPNFLICKNHLIQLLNVQIHIFRISSGLRIKLMDHSKF
jgi:hypothetical protein